MIFHLSASAATKTLCYFSVLQAFIQNLPHRLPVLRSGLGDDHRQHALMYVDSRYFVSRLYRLHVLTMHSAHNGRACGELLSTHVLPPLPKETTATYTHL